MKTFKEDMEIYEYIYNLCESKNIPIDCRFGCFGDTNEFYNCVNNKVFLIDCDSYYAKDINDVKQFFVDLIECLWKTFTRPNHRIALYVEEIVDKDGWYDVIVGSCLFEDNSLL